MSDLNYFLFTFALGLFICHLITPYPKVIFQRKQIN